MGFTAKTCDVIPLVARFGPTGTNLRYYIIDRYYIPYIPLQPDSCLFWSPKHGFFISKQRSNGFYEHQRHRDFEDLGSKPRTGQEVSFKVVPHRLLRLLELGCLGPVPKREKAAGKEKDKEGTQTFLR